MRERSPVPPPTRSWPGSPADENPHREVFRAAIRCDGGCTRIILVHNHPSGDATPSPQDIAITRQIAEAGRIVGIELVDHVILGRKSVSRDRDFLSLREAGEIRA
jgi:DNA repair protein RadC